MRFLAARSSIVRALGHFSAALFIGILSMQTAYAGPEGGVVVRGDGDIVRPNTTTTNITQNSHNIAINWDSFDVNANEVVNFYQPTSTSTALNRIFDQNASQIFGAINANGRVILVNANGIYFGQNATVNVGALIASGLDINPDAFMNDNWAFSNPDGSTGGLIVNHGLLQAAEGGSISLFGGGVINAGTIIADYGSINLAAGEQATIDFDGDGLINFAVDGELIENAYGTDAAVVNEGVIRANSGRVLLTAASANDVFAQVVNNSGVIQANGVASDGGRVFLTGSGGDVVSTGTITATSETGKGGDVRLLGDRVGLFGDAVVDVSGATGGGTALIGGDYQGGNGVQTSSHTVIGSNTVVRADSWESGHGGEIIIWSDGLTQFYGEISARGGTASGDGGFAEVSGLEHLVYRGSVDMRAPNGAVGTLLLDPRDIVIAGGSGASDNFGDDQILFAESAGTDVTVFEDDLESAGANIVLEAENSITTSGTFDNIANGEAVGVLLLPTGFDITMRTRNNTGDVNGSPVTPGIDLSAITVQTRGNGAITLQTGNDGAGGGGTDAGVSAGIIVGSLVTGSIADGNVGDIILDAEGAITVNGAITTGDLTATSASGQESGTISLTAGGDININAALTTGDVTVQDDNSSGDIIINSGGTVITGVAGTLTTGTATSTGNGDTPTSGSIDIDGANGVSLGAAVATGAISAADDGGISGNIDVSSSAGSITATAAATLTVGNATGDDQATSSGGVTLDAFTGINAGGAMTTGTVTRNGGGTATATTGNVTLSTDTGNIVAASIATGDATVDQSAAATGDIAITASNGELQLGGIVTGDATVTGGDFDATSGDVTLVSTLDDVILGGAIASGTASSVERNATSGAIGVTAGGAITGDASATLTTGNATGHGQGGDEFATSGTITVAAGGAVAMNAVDALATGDATITTGTGSPAGDFATVGDISITAASISSDGANGALDVSIGTGSLQTAEGAIVAGELTAATDGGAGDAGGIFITSGENLRVADIDTDGLAAQNVSITTTGAANLTILDMTETLSGDAINFATATGTLTVSDTAFATGAGSLTLTGDEIDLAGGANSITGTGSVTVQQADNAVDMTVGGATADAALNFTNTDLAALANGFSGITLGSATATGTLTVDSGGVAFNDALTLRMGGAGGDITVAGTLTGNDTATIALNAADTITLSANIVTAGNTVTLDATSIDLDDAALAIDTTNGGTATAGNAINFNSGAFTDTTGAASSLTLNAGAGGQIDLIGGNIGGSLDADASDIDINGALAVGGNVDFDTSAGTGGISDDGTGSLAVTGTTTLATNGAADVTLNSTSNDFATVAVTAANNVVLVDSDGIDLAASTVGGTLDVTASGNITDSGVLAVTGAASFNAGGTTVGANDVVLDAGNAFASTFTVTQSGDVTVNNGTTAIDFGASSIGGDLDATTDGTISQSGVLTITGGASFTTSGDDQAITLNAANDITGAVSFTTHSTVNDIGNVSFTNAHAGGTVLGTSTVAGSLAVVSDDAISQSGVIDVATTSTFTTNNAGQAITLNTSANALAGAVTFATNGTGGDVLLDNGTTAIDFAASSIGGDLTAVTGGTITQSGALTVGGGANFTTDLDDQAITLTNAANAIAGAVSFATQGTTGDVALTDSGAIDLGSSTIAGSLTLISGAGISNSGAATVAGNSSFTVTDTSDIILDADGNDFTGTVSFAAASGSINDITIDDASALGLAALDITGNLDVTAGGAITQSGVLAVDGTSSFATDVADQTITLDTQQNDLVGAASFSTTGTAGNVAIDNGTTNLVLGTSNVNGSFDANTDGTITQTGAVAVTGAATFATDIADQSITLDNTGNAFSGAVAFTTSGAAGHVTLDNGTTALDLATSTIGGNLGVVNGNAITQSGALTVGGTGSFTTDIADQSITLDNATNAITGAVSFSTLGTNGDVDFDNGTTAIVLAASTVNGALDVTTGSTIGQSGALAVSGASSFTTDLADQAITLTNTGNALAGAASFSTLGTAGNVTIDNGTTALDFGASTINGNLVVTVANDITQSGALNVTGTADFTTTGGTGDITLTNAGNDVDGVLSFDTATGPSSGTITYVNGDAGTENDTLTVGGTSSGGDISITAADSLTLEDNAIAAGANAVALTAQNGDIIDANASVGDDFNLANVTTTGQISLTANDGGVGSASVGGAGDADIDLADSTDLALDADNDIFISNNVQLTAFDLTLTPNNTTFSLSGATDITISTDPTDATVALVDNGGVALDFSFATTSGDIYIDDGAITNIGAGDVSITAQAGSILDSTAGADTLAGISLAGGALTLTASGTIGAAGDGDIDVDVTGTTNLFELASGGNITLGIGSASGGYARIAGLSTTAGNETITLDVTGNANLIVQGTGSGYVNVDSDDLVIDGGSGFLTFSNTDLTVDSLNVSNQSGVMGIVNTITANGTDAGGTNGIAIVTTGTIDGAGGLVTANNAGTAGDISLTAQSIGMGGVDLTVQLGTGTDAGELYVTTTGAAGAGEAYIDSNGQALEIGGLTAAGANTFSILNDGADIVFVNAINDADIGLVATTATSGNIDFSNTVTAGSLTVVAADNVNVDASIATADNGVGNAGAIDITAGGNIAGAATITSGTATGGTGAGGDISLDAANIGTVGTRLNLALGSGVDGFGQVHLATNGGDAFLASTGLVLLGDLSATTPGSTFDIQSNASIELVSTGVDTNAGNIDLVLDSSDAVAFSRDIALGSLDATAINSIINAANVSTAANGAGNSGDIDLAVSAGGITGTGSFATGDATAAGTVSSGSITVDVTTSIGNNVSFATGAANDTAGTAATAGDISLSANAAGAAGSQVSVDFGAGDIAGQLNLASTGGEFHVSSAGAVVVGDLTGTAGGDFFSIQGSTVDFAAGSVYTTLNTSGVEAIATAGGVSFNQDMTVDHLIVDATGEVVVDSDLVATGGLGNRFNITTTGAGGLSGTGSLTTADQVIANTIGVDNAFAGSILVDVVGAIEGVSFTAGSATVTGGLVGDSATAGNIWLEGSNIGSNGAVSANFGTADAGAGTSFAGTLSLLTDAAGGNADIAITTTTDIALAMVTTGTGADNLSIASSDSAGVIELTQPITDASVAGDHFSFSFADSGTPTADSSFTNNGNQLNLGTGTLSITADTPTLSGSVTATGGVTVGPADAGSTIGLGTGTGVFTLSDATLDILLGAGGGLLTVGNAGAGDVQIQGVTYIVGQTLTVVTGGDINDAADGGVAIAGGNLVLNAAGAIGNANAEGLNTNITSLEIVAADSFRGTESTAITLDGVAVTGNFDLTTQIAGQNIAQSGALDIGGTSSFTTNAGTVTLNDLLNDFTGAVSVGGTTVSLVDANDIVLGTVNATTLGVSTTGTITDTGVLTVSGTTTLTAGAANDIVLNSANNFGTVAVTSGNDVTLVDTNGLTLGNAAVSGTYDVTSSGAGNLALTGVITANALDFDISGGTGSITQTGGTLVVADAAAFTSNGTQNIQLNRNGNDFDSDASGDALTVSNAASVSLHDENDIVLGGVTATDLTVSTDGGDVTDTGTVLVSDLLQLDITGDVILDSAANNFNNITLTGITGNLTLNDVSGLNFFGISDVTGSLDITANGAITQAAALSVGGATDIGNAGNTVTLNNTANDFTGAVAVAGSTVALTDANAIDLGDITATTLTVNATGAITDSGDVIVSGTTSLAAGAANSITLDSVANDFGTVAVTSGNNVTLVDANDIALGAANVSGTYDVTADSIDITGAVTANALDFDVSASAGDITDTGGSLAVTGSSLFTVANGDDVILDGANNFDTDASGDTVSVAGTAGTVTLNDTSGIMLGDIAATALNVTATGSIGDAASTALAISGGADFDAGTTITLGDNVADTTNFGTLTVDGTSVTITEDSGTVFTGVNTVTGDLVLASAGTITDAAGTTLNVTGAGSNASFTANDGTAQDITLGDGVTDTTNFTTLTFNGSAVTITEDSATEIAGANSATSLDLTSSAGITNSDGVDITVTGNASFTAADEISVGADVTDATAFGTLTVNLNSGVTVANAVVFEDDGVVFSGTSTVTNGNLGIVSQAGSITDDNTADVTVSGSAGFLTNGGNITLNDTYAFGALNFGSAGVGTPGVVTIVETDAMVLTDDWADVPNSAGSLTLTSGGTITDADTDGGTNGTGINITGNASFTANSGASDVTLGEAGNDTTAFGSLTFDGATVSITEDSATVLAGNSSAATLNLTSNGAISDSGDIAVTGIATLVAGAVNNIQLDSATNNFGTVVVDNGLIGADAANVTIRDADGVDLGTASIAGNYDVTATAIDVTGAVTANTVDFDVSAGAGDITDTGGSLTIAGTSLFTVNGGDVLLDEATNDFDSNDTGDAVTVTGAAGTVTLTDEDAIRLGAMTAGALNVTAGGAVTQSGALDITGATDVDATGFNVAFTNAGNTFTGAITVDALGASLTNDTATALGASSIGANGLTVTSTGGNITQTGAVTVAGATSLTAGTNDITLGGLNNFNGVTVVSADDVTLNDTGAMTLTSIAATGAVAATAGGVLTVTSVATTGGADTDDITLQGTGVSLATVDADGLGDVSVTATTGAITDDTSAVSGDTVSLTANTSVGASGAAINTAANTLNITATTGDAFVSEADAVMLGTVTVGNDMTFDNTTGDILVGAVNVTGTLDLDAQDGSIQDDLDDTVTDITAGTAVLTASGDIGGDFGAVGAPAGATDTREALEINAGTLTLNADNVTVTDNGAATVTLSFAGDNFDYETANDILVGLITATNDVTLISSGGSINDSAINPDLTADINAGGDVSLTAQGEIGGSAHLDVASLTLSAAVTGTGDIEINDIGGTTLTSITTGNGSIVLNSTGSMELGTVTASGAVTIDSAAALTDSNGNSSVSGTAVTLAAATGIGTALNAINTTATTLDLDTTAGSIVINETDGVDLAAVSAPTFTLTAGGDVTDSGTLAVTGTTTLAAGANDITLDVGTNNFGTVVITSGDNVTLTDVNALVLGTSDIATNLAVTVGGNLTQSGAVDVGGTTDINAAGQSVTLTNAGNTFTGAITVDALGASLTNDTATVLGASSIGANGLVVNSTSGDVTQSGALTVTGTTAINAAGQDVTLTSANNFTGAVSGAGTTFAVTDANAIVLGDITATTLNVTASGDITDNSTGDLAVSGTTTLAAGAANDIVLDIVTNDFGTVAITSGDNVTLTDANDLVLGASTVTTNLVATVVAGDLTQSGAVDVGGTTDINASGQSVTLTNTDNTFTGAITVDALGASLTNDTATVLGVSGIGANGLVVNSASGDVTQSGALTVTGTTAINAAGQDVTLTNTANNFTGAVSGTGTTFAVTDANAILLDDITTTTLNVTATGAVTQTVGGVLAVSGVTTLAAGTANNITLDNTANDFNDVTVTTGNNVTLDDANAVDLGIVAASGSVNVHATTDITVSGAVSSGAAGSIVLDSDNVLTVNDTLTAGSGGVDLDAGTTMAINAAIAATGNGAIDLQSAGALSFGANGDITTGGDVSATSTGDAISMADGAVITTTGTGTITLLADTDVGLGRLVSASTVDITATDGEITDNTAGEDAGNENIVGSIVTLNAETGIGTFATGGSHAGDIDLNVTELDATLDADGNMGFFETDSLYINVLDAGLTAGNSIIIEAVGDINDHADDGLRDIIADTAEIIAGGDIGGDPQGATDVDTSLELDITNLSLTAGGAIDVTDLGTGTVTLDFIGATDFAYSTIFRDILIGVIDVTGVSNDVSITTQEGWIRDDNNDAIDIQATGSITLSAGDGIGDANGTLTLDAPVLDLHAGTDGTSDGLTGIINVVSDSSTGNVVVNNLISDDAAITFTQTSANNLAVTTVDAAGAIDIGNAGGTLTTGAIDTTVDGVSLDAAGIVINGDIAAAGDVSADSTASLVINGDIDADAIDLDADTTLDINAVLTTVAGGAVTVDSVGATSLDAGGSINAGGAVTFGGTDNGALDLGGAIVTSGDAVTFNNAVTLTAVSGIDTTNGAATGANVSFGSTVSGGQNLTVDAGSAGDVTFTGAVTGLSGLDVTGDLVNFTGNLGTAANGDVIIRNAGMLTFANASVVNLGGTFTQTGNGTTGGVSLGANITTSSDDILFSGAVTLTDNVTLDTTGLADITFQSGITGGGNDLVLDATGGVVQLSGTSSAIDAFTVIASNADINGSVGAGSFDFSNNVDLAGGVSLTASAGAVDIGGALTLGNTGTNSIASNGNQDILIGNINGTGANLNLDAAGDIDVGTVNLGTGNADFAVDTATASAGAVLHADSITADVVTLASGAGADDILDVAVIDAAGAVSITSAFTLAANTAITGSSLNVAGALSGARTLVVDVGGNASFDAINGLTGIDIVDAGNVAFDGAVTVGAQGLDLGNSGTLAFNGNITSSGAITQTGTGAVTLAGDIVTTADTVTFNGALSFTGNRSIATAGGAITIDNGITGAGGDLTLTANAAAITLGAASGIGTLDLNGSGGVTLSGAMSIDTLNIDGITGGALLASGNASISTGNTALDLTNFSDIRAAGGGGSLALDAGSGDVILPTVGASAALNALHVQGGQLTIRNVVTTGDQSYSGTGVNLAGTQTAGAGDIDVTGAITLASNLDMSAGNIALMGDINGAFDLDLTATGDIRIAGDAGATVALRTLTLTSGTGEVGAVTTSGAQSYATNVAVSGDLDGSSITFAQNVSFPGGATVRSDTIDFNGGASSVTGGGELTLLPATDGATIDLGGSGAILNLNALALNGYDAGLVIGGTVSSQDENAVIVPIASTIVVNEALDVGDGYLNLVSRDNITLVEGNLTASELVLLVSSHTGRILSEGGQDSTLVADRIILISGGQIGDNDGNDVWASANSGPGILQVASEASDASILNLGNSLAQIDNGEPAFAMARAVGLAPGNTQITSSAQTSANREQSGGLANEGFIDPSLFEDIALYEISGSGIALPVDQSEEEVFDEGPADDCNSDEENCDLEGTVGAIGAISPR